MRFYTMQHRYDCGIDLHARSLYVCILSQSGEVLVHRNLPADPDALLSAIAPYRDDIAVAVECIFTWYWLADLCRREKIPFVLGHALYMKAIHGGKTKNDRIDSRKIAGLLRSGMLPMAYVYPAEMRGTRDLMRRRTYLVRRRADLLAHIQNSNSQHNLPEFGRKIAYHIHRFPRVQDFASYARLVKCAKESAGKRPGSSGQKIGNVHLKWAFSEAAVLFIRANPCIPVATTTTPVLGRNVGSPSRLIGWPSRSLYITMSLSTGGCVLLPPSPEITGKRCGVQPYP